MLVLYLTRVKRVALIAQVWVLDIKSVAEMMGLNLPAVPGGEPGDHEPDCKPARHKTD